MKKRILSFLLVVAMVVAMVPATMIAAFAEASSNPTITYVGMAELDGKNTNGEYDSATKVMLNAYGNDTDGDNMRIIYTDEAIYVLVEVIDDTLVRYASGSGKCDFVFLGFSLGTSFQGMKRVYRDTTGQGRSVFQAPGAYVNMANGGSGTLETKYFGYTEDASGFRLEARFPVSEMSERDQAYYAAGKLEIGFTAGTQNGTDTDGTITTTYDGDTENRGWDGAATEDYFESGSYKAKNPSNYPVYAFEYSIEGEVEYTPSTNYIAYVESATLDGKNTDGEYDNAYSIPFSYGMWGATTNGDETLRVVYSDDAIYVLLESADTTETYDEDTGYASDFFALSFAIGTSYVATQLDYRTNAPQHTNQGGTVSMSTEWSLSATYFKKTVTADKIAFEAMFPVASMSAEDQAAFADGTLSVKIGAYVSDDWNIVETVSGVYNKRTSSTSPVSGAEALTFLEKPAAPETPEVTGPQIPYVFDITLDGAKTGDEYANALKVAMTYQPDTWWGSRAPDADDVAYLVYTDDAIYVYVQGDASGDTSADLTGIGFKIGSSYFGSNACKGASNPAATLYSIGSSTVEASFFAGSDDGKMSLEARFPFEGLTAEDQAAFANGTLEIAFNFMNKDDYSTVSDFPTTSYNAYNGESHFAKHIEPNLTFYSLEKLEKNDMTFISDAKYDGLNTNGEYDKAEAIVIGNKVSGTVKLPSGYSGYSIGDVPSGSYYKVIYADDGIYVFVNIADTTPAYYGTQGEGIQKADGFADQVAITYSIGGSFIGKDWGYRHGTMGATNTGAGTLTGYPSTQKDNNAAGWTYEIKFPYSGMTEDDKAAFTAGTLVAKFNVTIVDRMVNNGWGFYDGVIYTGDNIYEFTPATKTNYVESVVLDGKNTDREYNAATTFDFGYAGWGSVNHKQSFKVVYAPDAIYVLAEATDSTLNGTSDFFCIHFRIGSTYVGTKKSDRGVVDNLSEGVNNAGGTKTLPQTSAYVQKYFSDTAWSVEIRFPVADLTAAEREAYAAGTLDMAFSVTYMEAWAVYYMTEASSSYNNLSAAKLAALPATEFGARPETEAGFAGANLSLGENININYYADLTAEDAKNAFVKFTHNNKVFIVKPVVATDRIDRYVFTFKGLAPHLLGDDIDAVLMLNLKAVDTVEDYSALQNCKNLLANEKTTAEAKQLIYDLLAYGAASQNYLGYKTDALVNAGYEALASEYSRHPSVAVTVDGANTDGEYDKAITVAIDKEIEGTVKLPSGYSGYSIGDVPAGSYYKVLLTSDAIYVYVNIADTTPAYYGTQGEGIQEASYYADSMALTYKIGDSFIGKDWAYRHGCMGATNTGAGTLGQWPSKHKDNNDEGWSYEIKIPVSGMTADDKAAYAAGTLSVEFNVEIADRMVNSAWGWYDGVIYSDNATLDAYTSVPMTDKKVGDANLAAAYFAAAGIYHANTNKIYAKIALAYGENVENLTVTINGVEATLEATDAENVYIVYTDDIGVKDFDKTFTFVLSDGANEQTLTYSVNAYAHIKAENAKTDKMAALAQAMYCYGVSAEAYAAN